MKDNERKLSDFIDRLNAEQKPDEDECSTQSEELKKLYRTVRLVRSLKNPAMPEPGYPTKLAKAVAGRLARRRSATRKRWALTLGAVGVAAIFALFINFVVPFGNPNVVNAMEQAFNEVQAYHGILEITASNAQGESTEQGKLDVWADRDGHYYVKGLAGASQSLVTVNNGQRKWQIQPGQKRVQIFPALPDAYRFQFELGKEIQEAKNALSTKVIGEDTISGREAFIVEVTPKGGSPYRIWIDKKTELPLQKQTAMEHAIQYTLTYKEITFTDAIPAQLLTYHLPEGYQEINENPEQLVADLPEAREIAGFTGKTPATIPTGYSQDRVAVVPNRQLVKMYYRNPEQKQAIVMQGKAAGEFTTAPNALLGKMNDSVVEILSPVAGDAETSSIRWRKDGFEFTVLGNAPLDDLAAFAQGIMSGPLTMPSPEKQIAKPQVKVPYDLTVEKNDQQNADAGSSPWKLDPIFVAQVFVSLQMSPQGITGEYPLDTKDLTVSENNGIDAIVTVHDKRAPIKAVYLKRVVRQDETGIWTVVGYDPR